VSITITATTFFLFSPFGLELTTLTMVVAAMVTSKLDRKADSRTELYLNPSGSFSEPLSEPKFISRDNRFH
jgi:hypothetical protein